jgi:L-ribulose-5-phosphate 4-epimerase
MKGTNMSMYAEQKEAILRFSKRAYNEKLFVGTSGNLSVYDRASGVMVITPTSLDYTVMQADDIVVITLDGEIVEGRHAPSSEWRLHAEVYRHCNRAKAVVHTHSPYATSFAVSNESIPIILIEMVPFIGGDVPVAGFSVPGTIEVGVEAVKVLQDRDACLMQNHGVVCLGDTLEHAYKCSVYVEDAAKIYHLAKLNGNASLIQEKYLQIMFDKKRQKTSTWQSDSAHLINHDGGSYGESRPGDGLHPAV